MNFKQVESIENRTNNLTFSKQKFKIDQVKTSRLTNESNKEFIICNMNIYNSCFNCYIII